MDISIAPGERVGLPGPSGRGKSTLAKILAGYLKPDEGDITVDGKQIVHGSFNPVQILFQHPELAVNPRWKIKNILNEAGTPSADLLDSLKISSSWAERYPNELSGGELQRVCLARALDGRTGYLLCDEMTSMLDPLTQASIWKTVLETAAERNLGLLIISHDTALLDRLCHRKVEAFI
ncbi:ABC transporter ATP-binding protein [Maridesulfovibrio bastinii]|uniref:ABC transporter ATP-binding protein n=1 Tax=Maridesulfovibrio bastinii TaxID=47157 RepID=UPI003CCBE618